MESIDRDAKTEGAVENTTPGKAEGADRPLSDDRRTPDRGGGVFCGRQVPVFTKTLEINVRRDGVRNEQANAGENITSERPDKQNRI
jgi:hypothetical protein